MHSRYTQALLLIPCSLLACGGSPGQPTTVDEPEEAASSGLEAPEQGPTTPHALLEAIRDRVAGGEIDSVAELVLDYRTPDGGDIRAQVVEGIRTGDDRGDWAFSLSSLEALILRADEFGPPGEMLTAMLTQGSQQADGRLTDPSRYLVFSDAESQANIILVEHDGQLWLLFWESLTNLR